MRKQKYWGDGTHLSLKGTAFLTLEEMLTFSGQFNKTDDRELISAR